MHAGNEIACECEDVNLNCFVIIFCYYYYFVFNELIAHCNRFW